MDKLYIEVGVSKTDVYYTVRSGTSPNYTYAWKKMDVDILDDLSIGWSDIEDKPESFTPSSHAHGNLDNTGILKISGTAQASKNVVTNSNGELIAEDKPSIPSAASSVPSADVANGAVGSSSKYAKEDHQHPLSSAYATSTHTHSNMEVTTNKVSSSTGLSSNSTDTEYPSAKCVYDYIDDIIGGLVEDLLA